MSLVAETEVSRVQSYFGSVVDRYNLFHGSTAPQEFGHMPRGFGGDTHCSHWLSDLGLWQWTNTNSGKEEEDGTVISPVAPESCMFERVYERRV